MKNMRIALAACIVLMVASCKNGKEDSTSLDSSAATTVSAAPDNTNTATTPKDTPVTGTVDSTTATTATVPSGNVSPSNAGKAATVDTRTRKTSRRGRVILATLKASNALDKIEADNEGVYNRAEIMPSYPGGENQLRKFIESHIEYPQAAIDNNVEGTVTLAFAVDEHGNIYTPAVVSRKLGYGLEDEAVKVVKQMPKWNPGQIKGKNVKTRFTLPITYQLQ